LIHYHDIRNEGVREYGDEQAMFISNIEIVNGPNGIIPSTVRLYCVHDEIEESRGALYTSFLKPTFYLFSALANRHFCPIINESRRDLFDSLKPDIIKGTIQIVNCVPNEQRQIIERSGITEIVRQDFTTRLRVNIDSGYIRFVQESNARLNIVDMCMGPLDFATCVMEKFHAPILEGNQ